MGLLLCERAAQLGMQPAAARARMGAAAADAQRCLLETQAYFSKPLQDPFAGTQEIHEDAHH